MSPLDLYKSTSWGLSQKESHRYFARSKEEACTLADEGVAKVKALHWMG